MRLSEKRSSVIKAWLGKHDAKEIAGVLGCSDAFVRMILTGERSYNTPAGQEVVYLALRKAKLNKNFRNTVKRVA